MKKTIPSKSPAFLGLIIFHLPNFLIALFNQIIGSSNSQLCKKNSCSVKLQDWYLDHNPRKIPAENSWIIILQNNSKCLLLNDKQMPHKILFILLQKQSSRGVLRYCSFCYRSSRPEVYWDTVQFVTEAVVHRCSVKNVFLEISQNSQENTCARASF